VKCRIMLAVAVARWAEVTNDALECAALPGSATTMRLGR